MLPGGTFLGPWAFRTHLLFLHQWYNWNNPWGSYYDALQWWPLENFEEKRLYYSQILKHTRYARETQREKRGRASGVLHLLGSRLGIQSFGGSLFMVNLKHWSQTLKRGQRERKQPSWRSLDLQNREGWLFHVVMCLFEEVVLESKLMSGTCITKRKATSRALTTITCLWRC